MDYQGKIYRPWPEANSLLIQATLGCSNNQCTFCTMFDDKRFKVRDINEVFADIDEARAKYRHVESIFLIDGNVMAVRSELLLKLLNKLTSTFPELKNIALYAGYNDIRRKSIDDLKAFRKAGLSMVYTGLESGDPIVLEKIKKNLKREHVIEGAAMLKQAGIKMLASFIFGLGGKERSKEHIRATTDILNLTQPEEIAPMAIALQPGSELEREAQRGEFVLPSSLQVLEEEQYLLEHLNFQTYYWGDHGNNISPMKGWLPMHQRAFLSKIEHEIANNPITQQNVIQTFAW
ncbi:radical SAM protein [Neiella marina]|uniref:Radical SAM protein n=1 Tax=Neiella marina TaxID=508461 RepID=A0A8J2U4N8_9GAMM|nr:radical SAM protein [Neiella marina]GGA76308.1 radical SAM protein [Neiella marina]